MGQLVEVNHNKDIFSRFRNTPIEKLFEFHNLGKPCMSAMNTEIMLGMCVDFQPCLKIPENFAIFIHPGEVNFHYNRFEISYIVAFGGAKAIALIAHSNCEMVNLFTRKNQFVQGLVNNGGWEREEAEKYFLDIAPKFEMKNEINFVINEAKWIQSRYPEIPVAPLFYQSETKMLYQIHVN